MFNSSKKEKEKQLRQERESVKLIPWHYGFVENVQMLERFVALLYNIFFYYNKYFHKVIDQISCQNIYDLMFSLESIFYIDI